MAKKEKSTENNKNKKSFFKGFKAELKKVSWPTPKQLVNNTVAVIAIVLLTTVIVFALDLVFEAANKHGVEKLKEVISSSNETTTDDTTEGDTTDDATGTEATEGTSKDTTGENTDAENQDVQEVQLEDQTQNTETTQTENTANQ